MVIMKISFYHLSVKKILFDYGLILALSPLLVAIILITSLFVIFYSGFPILFIQDRVGKKGKVFSMCKFRTMVVQAEKLKTKYVKLNEADGPVFKIKDDPRYTKIGKFLSRTGLDELPQVINILRGEMSLVGPRPLPIYEAKKLTKEQNIRLLVKPGITSTWIANGHHKHTFNTWMNMDKEYVQNATLITDIEVLYRTMAIPANYVLNNLRHKT